MHTTTPTPPGKPCPAVLLSQALQSLAFRAHHPGLHIAPPNLAPLLAAKDTGATPFQPRKS